MAKAVIIGCGGFGINITAAVKNAVEENNLLGNVEFLAVDGSESNLRGKKLTEDEVMLCPDTDGAGKFRKAGAEAYIRWLDKEANSLPKAELYVLVYSISGGSGSVIGPRLHEMFLARGERVVSCVLAGTSSLADTENTMTVLNGMANISRTCERPLVISMETGTDMTASEVDELVASHAIQLARIAANQHGGLDTSDIRSVLDYTNRGVAPRLTLVERYEDADSINKQKGKMMTTLSLVKSQDSDRANVGGVMDTYGVIEDGQPEMFFGLTISGMDEAAKALKSVQEDQRRIRDSFDVSDTFGSADQAGMSY